MPEELQGAELVSAQFFDLLREPQLDSAILDATIEKIRELCPRVENFSFELVDGEETARAEGETSRVTVEASTPQSTVDAWNSVKLVGLFVLRGSVVCGAAIGSVKRDALDFKACALPVDGEDACPYAAHRPKLALRINFVGGRLRSLCPGTLHCCGWSCPSVFKAAIVGVRSLLHGTGYSGLQEVAGFEDGATLLEVRVGQLPWERLPQGAGSAWTGFG